MRTVILAALLLASSAALADDTKPPAITDVKASVKGSTVTVEAKITDETGVLSAICHHRGKGGKVEDTSMTKDDYDDVFKVSFPGSGDSEYWIESSDLLGNGPSTYGTSSKPLAANGKPVKPSTAVAAKEPAPKAETPRREPEPPAEEPKPKHHREESAQAEPAPHHGGGGKHTAKAAAAEPPVVEHRKPATQPAEGQDFTVRIKIHSESPVAVAILQSKQAGTSTFSNTPLQHTDGDSYEAKIPSASAKGTLEYFIAAKNAAGLMTRQGDGDSKTPYTVTFKAAAGDAATASADKGGWSFTHWPVTRIDVNKALLVRAQIAPSGDEGQVPDKAMVLFRGNDGQDQQVDMLPDPNGGFGGFKAELPAQADGAVYYQIVACDDAGKKCVVDTGSKKKWHGAAVGPKGSEAPMPLNATSSKVPAEVAD